MQIATDIATPLKKVWAQSSYTNEIGGTVVVCSFCNCEVDDDGECCCDYENLVNACACSVCYATITCDMPCLYCPLGNQEEEENSDNDDNYFNSVGYIASYYSGIYYGGYCGFGYDGFGYYVPVTSVGTTPTAPTTAAYSINEAVIVLNENANNSSQGECSRYVHNAIVAGGIEAAKNIPVQRGGAYRPLLQEWGFTMVTTTLVGYTPIIGDIAVIQGYLGGTTCASCGCPCGHIQMYNGDQWVSDFFQPTHRTFYPGPGYEENAPSFEIYRWEH